MARRFHVSGGTPRARVLVALAALCVIGLVSPEDVAARQYSAAAFSGRVVDADTGAPLGGVIVLAQWILEGGSMTRAPVGSLNMLETVTDEHGRYAFPAWGPRQAPVQPAWMLPAFLSYRDPQLYFLKTGYAHLHLNNAPTPRIGPEDWETELRVSRWEGKDIALRKLGDVKSRARDLDMLVGLEPPFGIRMRGCHWLEMPLTVQYIFSERSELRRQGGDPAGGDVVDQKGCMRPQWLKEDS
jgi:hypothetical protein